MKGLKHNRDSSNHNSTSRDVLNKTRLPKQQTTDGIIEATQGSLNQMLMRHSTKKQERPTRAKSILEEITLMRMMEHRGGAPAINIMHSLRTYNFRTLIPTKSHRAPRCGTNISKTKNIRRNLARYNGRANKMVVHKIEIRGGISRKIREEQVVVVVEAKSMKISGNNLTRINTNARKNTMETTKTNILANNKISKSNTQERLNTKKHHNSKDNKIKNIQENNSISRKHHNSNNKNRDNSKTGSTTIMLIDSSIMLHHNQKRDHKPVQDHLLRSSTLEIHQVENRKLHSDINKFIFS